MLSAGREGNSWRDGDLDKDTNCEHCLTESPLLFLGLQGKEEPLSRQGSLVRMKTALYLV